MIYVVLKDGYANPSTVLYSGTSAKDALIAASKTSAVHVKIWHKGNPLEAITEQEKV